ncbi:cobaltochelatase subunit CobN [Pectinatus sottacetonis]|uniref:cobaltochelatase subunit CobN n=1 Tax=Pectinatus sottacetonis TaxID=1002795 RepID=UPI0018C67C9D|nr:cobaltochelatase subunit CobN [Pectinatus sottacetonis]
MYKILFLSNVNRQLAAMQTAVSELQHKAILNDKCRCIWIDQVETWGEKWLDIMPGTGCVIVKWMGSGLDTPFLKHLLTYLQDNNVIYYIDSSGTEAGKYVKGLSCAQITQIKKYFLFGGQQNYMNFWLFIKNILCREDIKVPMPLLLPWCGIYHPDADHIYNNLTEYKNKFCRKNRITLGILFYREEWIWKDLFYQETLIREIERQGMNVICVFSNGMPSEDMGAPSLKEVFECFFYENAKPYIDVLINTMKFSMTNSASMTIAALKHFNVPVLQAYTLMSTYNDWKADFAGMNPMEISISVSLPEFDGVVHGGPVAARELADDGSMKYIPIAERIHILTNKARKWGILRHKDNKNKKIAIIFHNYPPRNSNIGSAIGLDTIESIRCLLIKMKQQGYIIDDIPADNKTFIAQLTDNATNDRTMLNEEKLTKAQKLEREKYIQFFTSLDESVQRQLNADWGKEPGSVMYYKNALLVPGMINGNIFITVQPPRGFGEDPAKIYHSPFTAPTHQYLAFYKWLRDEWQADAVAHIGTHGSLEWLPGKNAGLSNCCYPDLAIGDMPNIYPYLMSITGEGIQAKRRSSACLIDHLPAPQAQAGTYDELAELEKLLEEYVHFFRQESADLVKIQELIQEKVAQADLGNEVIYNAEKPFNEYVAALHNYITDLKNMQVHTGLHILGKPPEGEQLIDYIWLLTRLDNNNIVGLPGIVSRIYDTDYYYMLEHSSEVYKPLQITYGQLIDKVIEECQQIIEKLRINNFNSEKIRYIFSLDFLKNVSVDISEKIDSAARYICETIYPNLQLTIQESNNMLRAFAGEYIEPGPSGAPTSGGADLLPTGRNFYGIDQRTLPTPAAWEIGKTLAEQAISRFIEEEHRYPENIGIILWAGANMRSHGQCIAEFLYLMGIKPIWQRGSLRVTGLEIIPAAELKRPRIDVTARISGLFRDAVPVLMKLLDKAVLLAAKLDESFEVNFVRKHVSEDSKELQNEGLPAKDAWREAAFRIFGDEPGTYGAGIGALLEAKNWQNIDDLADVYVRWGAHAYGGKTRGKYLPQQFRKRMGSIDITIKNEDNHETNMLSSDDYNAYHGGMIAAVKSIKGQAPRSYCGDSTDRSKVVMHSVQEETKRIFRSEAVNPKFIAGMMKHGYKGAADMANYLAHSFQWDATSSVMEDWMYEKYAEKYALDEKVQKWLTDVNPWALQRMTEILLEAEQRKMWQAKPETREKLRKLYLSIEGDLEDRNDSSQ